MNSASNIADDLEVHVINVLAQLQILGQKVQLRGIVGFHSQVKSDASTGHYIVLCKRLNDYWEICNDLDKK